MTARRQSVEGRIHVRLSVRDGTLKRVDLASSRPVSMCSVLVGRRPSEVVGMVGMLYGACGRAQSLAALEALEGACGHEPPGRTRRVSRQLGVLGEVVREHATRLLLDWPLRLGRPEDVRALRELGRTIAALDALLPADATRWCERPAGDALATGCAGALVNALEMQLADALLGNAALSLAGLEDELGFERWRRAGSGLAWLPAALRAGGLEDAGTRSCPPMPPLDPADLERRLAEEGERFAARPQWGGTVFETGPLARLWRQPVVAAVCARDGAGVLARVTARLVELAGIPRRMRALLDGADDAQETAERVHRHAPQPGAALAVLETACGRLAHRVEVEDGRVSRYDTLAPREWNFHPAGPLVVGLTGRPVTGGAAASRLAEMAGAALDPCVALDVDTVAA